MASILGHFSAGYTIAKLIKSNSNVSILIIATISAFLPDIDVVSFRFGIPYEHLLGHRGITHSILFAFLWGILVALFYPKNRIIVFLIICIATVSHPFLDAMTTGGLGVAFFAPFDNTRYFFPLEYRVIKVSPIGISKFFSEWGWLVIKSELLFIVLPCSIFLFLKSLLIKK